MPHDRAGLPAEQRDLINVPRLVATYYELAPDPSVPEQQVVFGTSGHRGSAFDAAFNEAHIVATSQAIVEHRREAGIDGPLFVGKDTHALSEPAFLTALEVFHAAGLRVVMDAADGYTPTPAVSLAIIDHNRDRAAAEGTADGVVVTPSHNPPRDGGFKYNPPHGGPAGSDITGKVQDRTNELLATGVEAVKRSSATAALADAERYDYVTAYVDSLPQVVDVAAIRAAGVRIGADPLGGASVGYWGPIAERYGLDLTVVNERVDPAFGFMPLDKDGKIRMDCSSPAAMANLIAMRDSFDVAFGNDTDADRHGIVTPGAGLLNPNRYLAVLIDYLFQHRPGWRADAGIGKTLVSSSLIDLVAEGTGHPLVEVPVGFKWFVPGLSDGSLGFGGEESAGASLLRTDGRTWTTDKDGIVADLLAAEVLAVTGKDPGQRAAELVERFGDFAYARVDAPANREQKARLAALSPSDVTATQLAGDPIEAVLTNAPGNGAAIGGLKVVSAGGWFAARPSGTEDVYKIYAESYKGADHLARLQEEARALVSATLG